jgi:hypothetical protein
MGSQRVAVVGAGTLTSQDTSSRKLTLAIAGGRWPGSAPRFAPRSHQEPLSADSRPPAIERRSTRQISPVAMAGYACTNLTRRGHLQVGSPAAERWIASARRKCLDRMLILPCLGS